MPFKIRGMNKIIYVLPVLLLGACADMQQAYQNETCHREVGYERGVNDGNAGRPMDSSFASGCDSSSRFEVMNGYREGYESTRRGASFEAGAGGVKVSIPGVDIRVDGGGTTGTISGKPRWVCEVNIFGRTYTGLGATKGMAQASARQSCQTRHNEMHCTDTECREAR